MKVHLKLDFVLDVEADHLPRFNTLDLIEHGLKALNEPVKEILPGSKVAITRMRDQDVARRLKRLKQRHQSSVDE